jgi:hypothetical protein
MHRLFHEAVPTYNALRQDPKSFLTLQGIDRGEFLRSLGLGVNVLMTSRSLGKRWVESSPGYTTMVEMLAEMFPGARFLHLLRDGRAVVNSMIHFGGGAGVELAEGTPLEPWATDFATAVRTWRNYARIAADFCERHPDRTLTVRNEDLAERPEEEFATILAFLDVSASPGPAQFFRTSRLNSSFAPGIWMGEGDAVPRDRAEIAWAEWSDEQREMFTEGAGDLMKRLGYAVPEPH